MGDTNASGRGRDVVCEIVGEVVNALQQARIPALYVGRLTPASQGPAIPIRTLHSLDLLIREEDLDRFHTAMEGCDPHPLMLVREDPVKHETTEVPWPLDPSPANPGGTYARNLEYPADLLIRFYTTWRHGHLVLVDLGEWFDGYDDLSSASFAGCPNAGSLKIPPMWAMLLWHCGLAAGYAADLSIDEEALNHIRSIAGQLAGGDWNTVGQKAAEYEEAHYLARINRQPAQGMIEAYTSDEALRAAEREYGARYEARHVLESLSASPAGPLVPAEVLDELRTGTGLALRKAWEYTGVYRGDPVAEPSSQGKVGTAVESFTIRDQIRVCADPNVGFDDLLARRHVNQLTDAAPPHGPWHGCTQAQLQAIFGGVSPPRPQP